MHTHVIVHNPQGQRIIPRFCRYLQEYNGYTLGPQPDPSADFNLFVTYIQWAQHYNGWDATPTGAYFSHYDTANKTKAKWWDQAAASMDVRITNAQQYADILQPYGPTFTIKPPVDPVFCGPPLKTLQGTQPTIGVSGFTYGDNRKGEDLIATVYRATSRKYKWQATGRGWAVPTKGRSWDQMPNFYRSLDVLVCASRIEGVPMPPLEALACGVPVVVPRGVGLCDDLAGLAGVHMFTSGNPNSLQAAIAEAVHDQSSTDDIYRSAAAYTPEGWASGVAAAIESVLRPKPEPQPERAAWQDCAGVLVVAYGGPARGMAEQCLTSWQEHMPQVQTALISDAPLKIEDIFIHHPDSDLGARGPKTKMAQLAPEHWQYVLYVDADTELINPVPFLFDSLQAGWDLVMTKNPDKYHVFSNEVRPDNGDEMQQTIDMIGTGEIISINGGVVGWHRNPQTVALLNAWHDQWQVWGKRDQAAFYRALWDHPIRLLLLGNEWNTVTRYIQPSKSAGILHHPTTARRWQGIIKGRLDSPEAWRSNNDA